MTKPKRTRASETRHSPFGFPSSFGVWVSDFSSRHSFPASQAPFGDETGQRNQKNSRPVPQRDSPIFGDGRLSIRQVRGEAVEFGRRDDLAAGLPGDRFQQDSVRLQ